MKKLRPVYGFMAFLVIMAAVGWANTNPTAFASTLFQSVSPPATFGPVLFVIRANPAPKSVAAKVHNISPAAA